MVNILFIILRHIYILHKKLAILRIDFSIQVYDIKNIENLINFFYITLPQIKLYHLYRHKILFFFYVTFNEPNYNYFQYSMYLHYIV